MVACSTPYQEKAFTGGYVDRMVTPSTRIVEFWGNGGMSRKRVTDFALFRCAEVTLLNGYDYFAISRQGWLAEAEAQDQIKQGGAPFNDYFKIPTGYLGGASKPMEKPVLRLHIEMFHGVKPSGQENTFDAKDLQRELAEQYPELKKRLISRPSEIVS